MYCTTQKSTGKKLKFDIRSTDKMMNTVSIPFYFHQSLTQIFLFMLLRTNHSPEKENVLIPKLKEFHFFYHSETKAEIGIESKHLNMVNSVMRQLRLCPVCNVSEYIDAFIPTVKASVITMEK